MRMLGYVSKANPSLLFLEELRDHGRAAAETWLRTSLRHVGRNSSIDVGELLDAVLPSQLGFRNRASTEVVRFPAETSAIRRTQLFAPLYQRGSAENDV